VKVRWPAGLKKRNGRSLKGTTVTPIEGFKASTAERKGTTHHSYLEEVNLGGSDRRGGTFRSPIGAERLALSHPLPLMGGEKGETGGEALYSVRKLRGRRDCKGRERRRIGLANKR